MIVFVFLGIVVVAFVVLFMRSAMFKQLRRGNGIDAAQWGKPIEHLQDRGGEAGLRYDGGGGTRASRRVSKFMKPRH